MRASSPRQREGCGGKKIRGGRRVGDEADTLGGEKEEGGSAYGWREGSVACAHMWLPAPRDVDGGPVTHTSAVVGSRVSGKAAAYVCAGFWSCL